MHVIDQIKTQANNLHLFLTITVYTDILLSRVIFIETLDTYIYEKSHLHPRVYLTDYIDP